MPSTLAVLENQTLGNACNSALESLDSLFVVMGRAERLLADLINRGSALRAGLEGMRSDPECWQEPFMCQVAMFTEDVEDVYRKAVRLRLLNRFAGVAESGNEIGDEEVELAGGELVSGDAFDLLMSEQVRSTLKLLDGPEPDLLTFGEAKAVFGIDAVERIAEYRRRSK